jgi:hypothetical protein
MGEFHYTADKISAIDLRRMTLIEALLEIEKRPALWLQEKDISNLRSFVSGWIVGRRDSSDERLMHEFQEFVAKELGESSALGWCRIIRKHRGDNNALVSFFDLLRSFLAERAGVPSDGA